MPFICESSDNRSSTRVVCAPRPSLRSFHKGVAARLAEREWLERIERMRHRCQIAEHGWWMGDLVGCKVSWDRRAGAILGVDDSRHEGTSLWPKLVHPSDRAGVDAAWTAAQRVGGDGTFDRQFRIVRKDGSISLVHARGEVLFHGEGATCRAAAVAGSLELVRIMTSSFRPRVERVRPEKRSTQTQAAAPSVDLAGTMGATGMMATESSMSTRASAVKRPQQRVEQRDLRLLIVDDNEDLAISLSIILQRLGHQTHVVHDGLSALDAVEQFRPDILLLDIGLPGLNGYEVAQRLRVDERHRHLPIIAISGYGQQRDKQRSAEAGINHHLVKPVEQETLLGLIAQTAGGGNPPAAH